MLSIGVVLTALENGVLAHFHGRKAQVPCLDDLLLAEEKLEGLLALAGGVCGKWVGERLHVVCAYVRLGMSHLPTHTKRTKLAPVAFQGARVVRYHLVAGGRRLPLAFLEDLEWVGGWVGGLGWV